MLVEKENDLRQKSDHDILGEAFKLDKQLPEQEKSNSWPLNLKKKGILRYL